MKIMVVGDIHIHPDVSSERMTWLGRMVVEEKPDVFLQVGDWNDLQSLSEYDKGTKKAETQTLERDIEASKESIDLFLEALRLHNKQQLRKARPDLIRPDLVITLGNHEHRMDKAANKNPSMYGTICTHNLGFEDAGFKVVPFLKKYEIENFVFRHYASISNMGTALAGINHAHRMTQIDGQSHVVGHSHYLQIARWGVGKVRWGIVAGQFVSDDPKDAERIFGFLPAEPRGNWWNGVVMLDNVSNGNCSPRPIEYSEIKRLYK